MRTFAEAESESVRLLIGGQSWFNPFRNSQLWTACERLKERGALKAGAIANSYAIACPVCIQSDYQPCQQHPIKPTKKPEYFVATGVDQYLRGGKLVEHRLDLNEQREALGLA
jgi:hypothetical protein